MTSPDRPSMNDAGPRDPFNNSSYGTLVDRPYKRVDLPILDVDQFNDVVVRKYEEGGADRGLPADLALARSIVPAGTATFRDFSYIAPELPEYLPQNCTGCMDCVTLCPDTAILGKVLGEHDFERKLAAIEDPSERERFRAQWSKTRKYYDGPAKKSGEGGMFTITIDPSKCKGCAECVTVCDDGALRMIAKNDDVMTDVRKRHRRFKEFGPSDSRFVSDSLLADIMLQEKTHLYVGGAGSCAGCGEGTAIRMMCAATGAKHGDQWGIVAATGCNTVYTSTYPYNPYLVPWANSLFENAPAMAMGVRARWDQLGWHDRPIWCIGGDGAMYDIGFQSLSRMFASGMNIKVLVLDTQVYSNTGGQASTSTFTGQNTKMSVHGKAVAGKQERRKEIAQIAMMHPHTFVAQTTCAHTNHFYRAVLDALEYDGPAIVVCYTTCQPEHGVADNMASEQARLAVDTRAFPLVVYDPRKGDSLRERVSLQGNPASHEDWWTDPKTGRQVDFIDFARTEGRFAKQFDAEGNPSETLLRTRQDRLENWRLLQDLAGVRGGKPTVKKPAAPTTSPAPPVDARRGGEASVAPSPAPAPFHVGQAIRYFDGRGWLSGSVRAVEPTTFVELEDGSQLHTTPAVLAAGVREGVVQVDA